MDAPQISTLREEETPEPQPTPARTSKFRVKLLVSEGKRAGSQTSSSSRKPQQGDSDDEDELEEEEEEDQLIDDDDDTRPAPAAPVPLATPSSTRSSPVKRNRGGNRGGKRKSKGGASDHGKLMTWVEVGPSVDPPAPIPHPLQTEVWDASLGAAATSAPVSTVPKKKRQYCKRHRPTSYPQESSQVCVVCLPFIESLMYTVRQSPQICPAQSPR